LNTAKENDWVTLLIATMNGKYDASANDIVKNGSRTTRIRSMFLFPAAPGQGVISTASFNASITHYGSNPRLMPVMEVPQPWQPAPPAAQYLPYKFARIKRSAEVGLIFDASLIHLTGDPLDTWIQNYTFPVVYNIDGGNNPSSTLGGG